MKRRIVWNDLKSNKLLSISTWIFMALSAFLFALTCFLFSGLVGSIDVLIEKAQTPDYLQMHAGEIDFAELEEFAAGNPDVKEYQTVRFLNLDNGSILLGGYSLADSTQDNGVCVQSGKFDFLVDMDNKIIEVQNGEIYVPVCYRQEFRGKQADVGSADGSDAQEFRGKQADAGSTDESNAQEDAAGNGTSGAAQGLSVGDTVKIGQETFVLAGFLRDSQMNSMMASSKRFLVSEDDYQKLLPAGSEEYIIEYLLKDGADTNTFAESYASAGLPANGPAITRPLVKMINAISGGILAFVILLVSVVMLLISLLCIRFTLLDKLASDKREIGMLKAVGIGRKDIMQMYFLKYIALSAAGALAGLLAAFFVRQPLQAGMQELYGVSKNAGTTFLVAVLGALLTQGILLLSIRSTLKKIERMSVVEAVTGIDSTDKGKRSYFLVVFVIACGVFLMTVPQNLYSTISSKTFVTYMGIGDAEIRMDIRQTDDIDEKTDRVRDMLSGDSQVEKQVSLLTKVYKIHLPDGTDTRLNVEQGDHTVFPVSYSEGSAPVKENEIALSYLCAKDYNVTVGDTLEIVLENEEDASQSLDMDGKAQSPSEAQNMEGSDADLILPGESKKGQTAVFTVCGIYSDITNGGKTAKTIAMNDDAPVMWSILYVTLKGGVPKDGFMLRWENKLSSEGISARITDIQDFVLAMFGPTMQQISLASKVAMVASALVMVTVVFLFTRLMMAKDRNDISLHKALGFKDKAITKRYLKKYLLAALAGTVLGILAGNVLGEGIAGIMLNSLGAAGFQFIINAPVVYLAVPVLVFAVILFATLMGLRKILEVRAYECCMVRL